MTYMYNPEQARNLLDFIRSLPACRRVRRKRGQIQVGSRERTGWRWHSAGGWPGNLAQLMGWAEREGETDLQLMLHRAQHERSQFERALAFIVRQEPVLRLVGVAS